MYIQRVLQSAKLRGIQGSPEIRGKIADKLSAEFTKLVMDSFEKNEKKFAKSVVFRADIKRILKRLAPKVKIEVRQLKSGCPHISPVYDKTKTDAVVKSWCLHIPFKYDSLPSDDFDRLGSLNHEVRHLFQFITEPKFTNKFSTSGLSVANSDDTLKFYEKFLYTDELRRYKSKDHLHSDKEARAVFVKNKIQKFFDKNIGSPEEKIEWLQKYRHLLKSETVAYKEGFLTGIVQEFTIGDIIQKLKCGKELEMEHTNVLGVTRLISTSKFPTLPEKIKELKSVMQESGQADYNDFIDGEFFIPQKISILEEMLAQELAKVRLQNKVISENKDLLK